MTKKIKILGFTGSLRRNSYNLAALNAAQELVPEDVILEVFDLSQIPFFNEDVEAEGLPQIVEDFKQKIAEADGLLIATPEYNYSIPPVLKNALDWASRGPITPLKGKPLAIMSASISFLGGARVQYHLRQVCVGLELEPLNKPEVFISSANTKFDQEGKLNDERTKSSIEKLLQGLVKKIKRKKLVDK